MDQKIKDFYTELKIPVGKMISVGNKRGLTSESILKAAEEVYNEINSGLEIKPIRIAWRVYEKATNAMPRQREDRDNSLSEIKDTVQALKAMMDEYTKPWYKKMWRPKKNV